MKDNNPMTDNPNQHGYICPNCGNAGKFSVVSTNWVSVTDEGADSYDESLPNHDTDWDENSPCKCPKCQFEGKVGDLEGNRKFDCTVAMDVRAYGTFSVWGKDIEDAMKGVSASEVGIRFQPHGSGGDISYEQPNEISITEVEWSDVNGQGVKDTLIPEVLDDDPDWVRFCIPANLKGKPLIFRLDGDSFCAEVMGDSSCLISYGRNFPEAIEALSVIVAVEDISNAS